MTQNRRLKQKVETLQEALKKMEAEVSAENFLELNEKAGDIPKHLLINVNRKMTGRVGEYDPKIRRFALSLHLKSAKAYQYVRSCFHNALPAESTIRAWCRKSDFSPGFCDVALGHLSYLVSKRSIIDMYVFAC